MELYDEELEIRVLRTLCSRRSSPDCAKLLSRLDRDFFRHPYSRRVFRRIKASLQRRGHAPSWAALRTDPTLSDAARKHIKIYNDIGPLPRKAGRDQYEELYESLNRFYQKRLLWDVNEDGLKELEKETPDVDALMDTMANTLAKARTGANFSQPLRLSGDDEDNSKDDFNQLLSTDSPPVIPTGYKAFDERNGGLLRGSLVILASPTGSGKALRSDTPIATPDGWTEIGKLKQGDRVFDEQGRPCRVLDVYPQGIQPCYEVKFSDSSSLFADKNHLWTTVDANWRSRNSNKKKKKPEDWTAQAPVTTKEIALSLKVLDRRNHSIPVAKALVTPYVDLPMDPYCMGVWLGDGHTVSPVITVHKKDAAWYEQKFTEAGLPWRYLREDSRNSNTHHYSFSKGHKYDPDKKYGTY